VGAFEITGIQVVSAAVKLEDIGKSAPVEVAMGMFQTRADCLRALRPNQRFSVAKPPSGYPMWTYASYTVKAIWPSLHDTDAIVVEAWELQGQPFTLPFSSVVAVG
jgi:hypothetical protein